MYDTNKILAGFSSIPAVAYFIQTEVLIALLSAVVLPIVFFVVGKTIDVLLKIHLDNKHEAKRIQDELDDDELDF